MTSPDEPTSQDPTSFRYALYRSAGRSPCSINGLPSWIVPSTVSITQTDLSSNGGPKHDPVFQAAKFSHEDWAERLKSTSPVKRGSKSKRPPVSKSDSLADQDAMDIDPSEPEPPRTNGIQVDDLANEAPFKSEGLNGVDDLTQNLPFQSRAAKTADVERAPLFRLNLSDLPPRPKPVTGTARGSIDPRELDSVSPEHENIHEGMEYVRGQNDGSLQGETRASEPVYG